METTKEKSLQNASNSYQLSDGENVKYWNDTSPFLTQKLKANQATSLLQPIYKKNGIGGLPTIFFDANSNGSSGKNIIIPFYPEINTSTFTIFLVTEPLEETSQWGAVINSRYKVIRGYSFFKKTNNQAWSFRTGDGTTTSVVNENKITFNKPTVITLFNDLVTQKTYEKSVFKSQISSVKFKKNTTDSFYIGGHIDEANIPRFYDGNISEIIYYGRNLNDNERIQVEGYLKQKYRIN